jgi:hypothetical protein
VRQNLKSLLKYGRFDGNEKVLGYIGVGGLGVVYSYEACENKKGALKLEI